MFSNLKLGEPSAQLAEFIDELFFGLCLTVHPGVLRTPTGVSWEGRWKQRWRNALGVITPLNPASLLRRV